MKNTSLKFRYILFIDLSWSLRLPKGEIKGERKNSYICHVYQIKMHSLPCKEITKVILPHFILSDAILFEYLLFYICRSLKIGPEFGLRLVLSSPINIRQPISLPLLLFYKLLLLLLLVWETFTNILAPFLLFKILKLITVVWLSLGQTPSLFWDIFNLS